MALRLIYLTGGPRERVLQAILDDGHIVTQIIANDPRRWPKVIPTLELAARAGIEVSIVQSKSDFVSLKDSFLGSGCFSAGFNYLIPKDIIDQADFFLNVHGSLLPDYGGARTLSWAIEHGVRESGVTVHLIDEGIDTGPIVFQERFSLSPFETSRSLARKTGEFEPMVVSKALRLFEAYGSTIARPQPSTRPQLLPNRVPEHSRLDPTRPLVELFNQIRAADPDNYPAYFYHEGEKVCIRLWRPDKPADEADLI